ncbi:hypothetical protein M9H77_13811 [Catharanthus roseus]|uniref:Uncharacterized protein n=1 Tax=Catharanthus roseus TaxID=4058 RepID=A0ACC0BL79_CATRO|nr:hypothetical protein M9H77_13811 [Catharanthus roseus]
MATFMSQKFNKYWDCYSIVLSFLIILDPRYKLNRLYSLFDEYMQAPNTCLSTFDTGGNLNEGDIVVDDMDLYNFAKECRCVDLYKRLVVWVPISYEDCDDHNKDDEDDGISIDI